MLGVALTLGVVGCSEQTSTTSGTTDAQPEVATETTPTTTETPAEATATGPTAPEGTAPGDVAWRKPADGEEVGILDTAQGRIIVMFFPDKAPKMVERFKECITNGTYEGTYFHRVIPGFMIQGGDPNTKNADKGDDGSGGYGANVQAEFNDVKHVRGILSTARSGDPNSAQSQFFIMHNTYPSLDNQYTVFGKVVSGMEAVDKIVNQPKGANDNPNDSKAVTIKKASLAKWPVKN